MKIRGACHCGNIGFTLDWQPEPLEIPARACGCTFCVKHGGVWTSCPTGTLDVSVREPGRTSRYAFGTHTATFHLCSVCGAAPVVTSEIAGTTYGLVNVNTFEGVAPSLLRRASADFDGESTGDRLARRARGWIRHVRFAAAGDLPFAVQRLDHVVLRVRDLERSIAFYGRVLGCPVEKRNDALGLVHLRSGASMLDLVSVDGPLGQAGGGPAGPGSRNVDHLCLRIDPFDEAALQAHLRACGVMPHGPVVRNFGAEGTGPSLYLSDPDGNTVELKGPSD